MNRLDTELHRLYPAPAAPGQVRAMVLELARPASWEALSRVWQGVQAELELPAPAIAVSGVDGYQLWFSLAHAVPAAEAANFLEQLRRRYLADIAPERLALHPWLDLPPGLDQQAELLSRLTSIKPAELGRALARLLATPEAAQAPQAAAGGAATTPKAFLLEVMNDRAAPLALRIEAAKALLPYLDDPH
jgi:hypothetical protein